MSSGSPATNDTGRRPGVDGRAERWRSHRAKRRIELIDAAVTAIGVHGTDTRMEQIAAVAGTTKPKLYRHFAAKSDLVDAVAERAVDVVTAAITARRSSRSTRSALSTGLDCYFAFVEENTNLVLFLSDQARQSGLTPILLDQARAVVSHLRPEVDRTSVPPAEVELLSHTIAGAVIGATDVWARQSSDVRVPRARLVRQLAEVLTGATAPVVPRA